MNYDIRQVVLLGTGLDTRAFRLNWEVGTHIYEIDHSDVLHYKESVLAEIHPHCERHSICGDLTQSDWSQLLIEQGYQTSELSIWLLEGFLYYLNSTEVHNLLTKIKNLAIAGSWFAANIINWVVLNGFHDWAKYWQSSCDYPEFFLAYGWTSVVQPGEEGASFGRYTYQLSDRSVPDTEHIFFVTVYRQD